MRANYLIHCQDCGMPRRAYSSSTRYCLTCRFLNDSSYWFRRDELRHCRYCETTEFLPFHNEDRLCHKCAYTLPDERSTCSLCGTRDAHTIREHDVCYRCATDPRQRRVFLAALEQRQAAQRSQYGHLRGTPPQSLRRRPEPAHA